MAEILTLEGLSCDSVVVSLFRCSCWWLPVSEISTKYSSSPPYLQCLPVQQGNNNIIADEMDPVATILIMHSLIHNMHKCHVPIYQNEDNSS